MSIFITTIPVFSSYSTFSVSIEINDGRTWTANTDVLKQQKLTSCSFKKLNFVEQLTAKMLVEYSSQGFQTISRTGQVPFEEQLNDTVFPNNQSVLPSVLTRVQKYICPDFVAAFKICLFLQYDKIVIDSKFFWFVRIGRKYVLVEIRSQIRIFKSSKM